MEPKGEETRIEEPMREVVLRFREELASRTISFSLAQSKAGSPVQGLDDGDHHFGKHLQASKLDVVSQFRFLSSVLWPLQFVDSALLSYQNNYKTENWLHKFALLQNAGVMWDQMVKIRVTRETLKIGISAMRSVLRRVLREAGEARFKV